MKKVIIINGIAQSGKDSFADFLIKCSKNTATKISTVDNVKEMCLTMFGADPSNKCDKNRKLWCDFKNLWISFNNGPFNDVVEFIKKSDKNIFCVFAREPTEIQKFKDHYGADCLTILIRRDGLQVPDNTADKEVENYEYDRYIHSKSLEYLDKKAKEFYHKIVGLEIMHPVEPAKFCEQSIGRALRQKPTMSMKDFDKFYIGKFENQITVIKWQHEETGRTCEMPVGKRPGLRWYKISAS